MKITMLVYPQMTLLDLVGPLQVWSLWPDSETQLVWKDTNPVPSDSAATLVPTHSFADAWAHPDILFTGGGLSREPDRIYSQVLQMKPADLLPQDDQPKMSRKEAIAELIEALEKSARL